MTAANENPTGPSFSLLHLEHDGSSVLRLRLLALSEHAPLVTHPQYVIAVLFSAFFLFLFYVDVLLALSIFVLIGPLTILLFYTVTGEFYDERCLTIDGRNVMYENISPNSKRQRLQFLGATRELQFKAVQTSKGKDQLAFWIGLERVTFPCDTREQLHEMVAALEEFMKQFEPEAKETLYTYDARTLLCDEDEGFQMNAASYYSKQNFTERVMAFFLMVMCGGYYWWQLFWGLPNVIRQCVDFWLLFPAEVALYYTAVLGGTCLIFVMMVVVLPLVVLNGVYWTSWSLRCDLKENEIRVLRSSLFRTKRAAADLSRISVGKKRPLSLLRLFWPPYWSSFSWGRAALEFDLDGRRFRWPCATEEEADWLLDALEKRRISVTRG